MNETHDPLEAELQSLRPHAPSAGLKDRIAARLKDGVRLSLADRPLWSIAGWLRFAKQNTARFAIAGAVLAAAVALAVILPRPLQPTQANSSDLTAESSLATAFDDSAPSVWQFHRALSHSINHVDDLLDKYSGATLVPAHEQTPIRGFGPFDTSLSNFPGEL